MVSALWINDPAQVIVLTPGRARRMSMTAFLKGLRGGQRAVNAAIKAGIHRPFDYLKYDPANRVPEPDVDCIGARYLTIGPLIPAQLILRDGGSDDLEAFMDRLFRYRCDANLAARHCAAWLAWAGADVERIARR